jgi:hypothetical protein
MTEPGPRVLAEALRAFAVGAADLAAGILDGGQPRAGAHAASWMRASREALEAARLAAEPLTDDERADLERHIAHLHTKVDTVTQALDSSVEQRDSLASFLLDLAARLDSAPSPTSLRLAGAIRGKLEDMVPDYLGALADEAAAG